jgi:hypothetical protein
MIKQLDILEHNKQVYLELLKDMQSKRAGLFTFILRVSSGEIVDYVVVENIPPQAFNETRDI